MIWWTGLAPWEFEFVFFLDSLTSAILGLQDLKLRLVDGRNVSRFSWENSTLDDLTLRVCRRAPLLASGRVMTFIG